MMNRARTRSTRLALGAVVVSAGLLFAACGSDSETSTGGGGGGGGGATGSGDAKAGQETYSSTCAACHGQDAKGMPNLGKDLTTSAFVKSQTDEQLLAFIKKGRDTSDPANTTGVAMPPKGGNPALTDDQLNNVIAYVRTVNK